MHIFVTFILILNTSVFEQVNIPAQSIPWGCRGRVSHFEFGVSFGP